MIVIDIQHEATNFGVQVINNKAQVKGKLGHVLQIHVCRFP